jgi:hypothetical protein
MSTLQQMGTPQNGGELVQFVAALNWMGSSLPLSAKKPAPLQDLLEVVYQEGKGRLEEGNLGGIGRELNEFVRESLPPVTGRHTDTHDHCPSRREAARLCVH